MFSNSTASTQIAQDLIQLRSQGATGELQILGNSDTKDPEWRLYFYLGRIVYATGGCHPVRLWYRAVQRHCPAMLSPDWVGGLSNIGELWQAELLDRAITDGLTSLAEGKAIIQQIVCEALFAFVSRPTLESRWVPGKPIAQQRVFLGVEQVITEAQNLRDLWQSAGLGHLQDLLLTFSPDLAPIIPFPEQLESELPAAVFQNLSRLMQGKRTLWDVAAAINRPLPTMIRFLLPLIRRGLIELREIPDLPPPITPTQTQVLPAPAKFRGKIACIDDSPAVGKTLAGILEPAGYQVEAVLDPLAAIARLLEIQPDLIFLDLIMPNTNGYELCGFLRKTAKFQDIPIVILTGRDGAIDRVRAKLAGASDFMGKPPDAYKVLYTVRKHLQDLAGETQDDRAPA